MKRIVVYKSSTGFTAKYANWIAKRLECEAVEFKKNLNLADYNQVVYGGWIFAGMVVGYDKVKEMNLNNVVVFGVGMSVPTEQVISTIVEANKLDANRFFYFEGGYNPKKVNFFKRMMMNMIKNSIEKKDEKTPEDLHMLETFKGADCTSEEAITPLVDYVIKVTEA